MSQISATAIICGVGINAHTIIRTLQHLNWQGHIVLLRHSSEPVGFAGCINPRIEQWAVSINSPDELPDLIEVRYRHMEKVFVFFTDERYHPAFATWKETHPDSKLRVYLGSDARMTTILDRYEFCRFIETRELAIVPRTITGEEDPFTAFGDTFIVRPRYSWFGVTQRERVKLVRGRAEYDAVLHEFESRGLMFSDLSFQELLSIRDEDNVSICGWYGPDVQHLFCSRKLLQYPPRTGSGDLVELIQSPGGIMDQAKSILASLSYEGPFEMEFVFDAQANSFKVTELNPRFWLQHGLLERVSGCALVSSYIGCSPLPMTDSAQNLRYWVNPLYSVYRACKLEFRSFRHWRSNHAWAPLTMGEACRYGLHIILDKVQRAHR